MSKEKTIQISREEIKQYLNDLKNGDTKSRVIAAYMLGTVGKKDESIKNALRKALNDKNWEVRKWSALSLGEMGDKESRLVPILIDILKKDDSKEFRSHAAVILGELEKRAIPALPALHQASQDENVRIKEWACWALNKIIGEIPCNKPNYPEERPSLSERIRIVRMEESK
ncbi:MAG: HEAT repeat domain-containing protein [Candidatus Thorarchaeota archaeon]